jgi:hypothetical protein
MIKYLFNHRFELIDSFIYHINRKGIGECIYKLLTTNSEDIPNSTDRKFEIIEKLLDKLADEKDSEFISNISDIFIESLINRRFYHLFKINPKLLENIYCILQQRIDEAYLIKEIIKVLIKINENILKDFGNIVTPVFQTEPSNDIILSLGLVDNSNIDEEIKIENTPESRANLEKIFEILAKSVYLIANDFVKENNPEYIDTSYEEKKVVLGTKK